MVIVMKKIEEFDLEKVKDMDKDSDEFKYFCYVLYTDCKKKKKDLEIVCETLKLDFHDVRKKAKNYQKNDLHNYKNVFSANDKRENYIKHGFGNGKAAFVEQLLITEDEDEILELLVKQNMPINNLSGIIQGYIINMYPMESEHLLKEIEKKLDVYRKYSKENYLKYLQIDHDEFVEVRASFAMRLAKDILEHDTETLFFKQLPKRYHLGLGVFESVLEIWKKEKVYDLIVQKFEQNRNKRQSDYEDVIRKILPLTEKNAIRIGNNTRTMDLIDLYSYFGEDIDIIMDIFKEKKELFEENPQDRWTTNRRYSMLKSKVMTNFANNGGVVNFQGNVSVFSDLEKNVIERALSDRREINFTKFDKDGFPVFGSGYVLTSEDKLRICDALHSLNLPVTLSNYDAMVRHFNDGNVELITRDNIDEYLEKQNQKSK